ncbi:MAG: O-antigen ligase domain-containing protein [Gammaproteobacteria bacterium]|nr:O-antigen ligase domain-containing protein [Gammaproteobacteria bacterium]
MKIIPIKKLIEEVRYHRWSQLLPLNKDEKVIGYSISFTFLFYSVGALYLVAPVIGWLFLAVIMLRWTAGEKLFFKNTKWLIYLWFLSAIILEFALIMGHLDFNLGFGKIIKSTVGWAKGWALLSIFIVLGYMLKIRYQVVCRAACIVGLVALLITPVLVLSYIASLPEVLFISPLKILGGSGPEYFTVQLYEIDPFNGRPRWRFFAPWAPAVGFVANIYIMCAFFEKDPIWRFLGLAGNGIMIFLAVSRMGVIVVLLVPIAVWGLSRLTRSWIMISTAIGLLLVAIFFEPVFDFISTTINDIKASRANSTRVRTALGNIAFYRWESEAYWFGHGVVEAGTHLVEFMPIGSHHNWYGLLFVKGIVGFLAFLIPFALTIAVLLVKAQYQVSSRLALGMCLILTFFSLSENIEALAYMTWPAWLLVGIGIRDSIEDIDSYQGNLLGQFRLYSEITKAKTDRVKK